MTKIKDFIFWLRWKLMPKELQEGTWLLIDGDGTNLNNMWRKGREKGDWFLPRITIHKYKKSFDKIRLNSFPKDWWVIK